MGTNESDDTLLQQRHFSGQRCIIISSTIYGLWIHIQITCTVQLRSGVPLYMVLSRKICDNFRPPVTWTEIVWLCLLAVSILLQSYIRKHENMDYVSDWVSFNYMYRNIGTLYYTVHTKNIYTKLIRWEGENINTVYENNNVLSELLLLLVRSVMRTGVIW